MDQDVELFKSLNQALVLGFLQSSAKLIFISQYFGDVNVV